MGKNHYYLVEKAGYAVDGAAKNGKALNTARDILATFRKKYTEMKGSDWRLMQEDTIYRGRQRGKDWRFQNLDTGDFFHLVFFPETKANDREISLFQE